MQQSLYEVAWHTNQLWKGHRTCRDNPLSGIDTVIPSLSVFCVVLTDALQPDKLRLIANNTMPLAHVKYVVYALSFTVLTFNIVMRILKKESGPGVQYLGSRG